MYNILLLENIAKKNKNENLTDAAKNTYIPKILIHSCRHLTEWQMIQLLEN